MINQNPCMMAGLPVDEMAVGPLLGNYRREERASC
jgi:hypothetical protein